MTAYSIEQILANQQGRFYYLASPYSHPEQSVRDERAAEVNRYAGVLMSKGVYVIPTIYVTHENAKRFSLPYEHEWWIGFNKALIDPSAGMLIAQMPGWDSSRGIVQEINYCRNVAEKSVVMVHISQDNVITANLYPGK